MIQWLLDKLPLDSLSRNLARRGWRAVPRHIFEQHFPNHGGWWPNGSTEPPGETKIHGWSDGHPKP